MPSRAAFTAPGQASASFSRSGSETRPVARRPDCPDVLTAFSKKLEGDLAPTLCADLERHVDACAACRGACDSLKRALATCAHLAREPRAGGHQGVGPQGGARGARQQRIAEQDGHRPLRAQVAREHGPVVDVEADQEPGETLLEIGAIAREAEHRHHFGRGRHVEALLSRDTVPRPAQTDDDVPESAIVHVDAAAPDDASGIEARAAAVVQIVVRERREEVVGRRRPRRCRR